VRVGAHTVHRFDTSPTPSIIRRVDLSTTIIRYRLHFSQRSKLFETLKHFAPLHCFIIFFLTPNSWNASANASTPSNILYRTLFWSSKGNLFLTPTDICCILIGLHHPLTVWSIRCGMFFLLRFFLRLGFLTLSLRAPLELSVFFFSVGSLCFQTLISSLFIFFAALLMARSKVTPNPSPSSQNPPTKTRRANPSSSRPTKGS